MAVTWDKVPNLPANLRAFGNAFNRRFPGRDGESDGAWGDQAHKSSPSGHNLDDTSGSRPESEDADNIPELRAIDVDADLREPGVTMQDVADAIIADAECRARLQYVIFNRRIAGKHNSWKWAPYSGDNPHDKHMHLSGDPDEDDNGAPVGAVVNYSTGGGELSQRASDLIEAMARKSGTKGLPAVPEKDSPFNKIEQIFDRLPKIEKAINDLNAAVLKLGAASNRAQADRSDAADALQAGVVSPLSIERNLTAATPKQLREELARRGGDE